MTFATPAEKSAALADNAIRFAESIAALEAEPDTLARAIKAAVTITHADFERGRIMAAPCRPVRPGFHAGGLTAYPQVLRRDP